MNPKHRATRVVSNPEILGGTPCIEGTRVPAGTVMADVEAGTLKEEIYRSYPSLPPKSVECAIKWDRNGRPVVTVK